MFPYLLKLFVLHASAPEFLSTVAVRLGLQVAPVRFVQEETQKGGNRVVGCSVFTQL